MPDSPSDAHVENTTDESLTSNQGATAESPTVNEGAPADSPAADQGSKDDSLVDRITKAVNSVSKDATPGSEGIEGEGTSPEGNANSAVSEDDDKPFTKDDLPHLHSKTRRRVGKLLGDVERLSSEVSQYKPAAENYLEVMAFAREKGLSTKDVNDAILIAGEINTNPEKALERLLPLVENLQRVTGKVLPDDLSDQVQRGFITEAHAKELAAVRAENARLKVDKDSDEERIARQREEKAREQAGSVQRTISDWESKWASSDPDYSKLRDDVKDEIELAITRALKAGTMPRDPAAALKMVEDCKTRVKAKLTKYQPPRTAVNHVTGGSPAASAKPQPKSTLEAISFAVNG